MIPFIIAGAIGYGIAKLFEKDDTKKFVKGGGVEGETVSFWLNEGINAQLWVKENGLEGYDIEYDEGDEINNYGDRVNVFGIDFLKLNYIANKRPNGVKDYLIEIGDTFAGGGQAGEIESMKRMMQSLYTYGGIDRGSYGFNKYLSKYMDILGEKLFNKTYNEELKRLQEYEVVQNVHTDSEGLTYNSLKRKLKEGGIVQDSWRKSGEGNLSIAETKKVAKKYAEGLSMSGEGIFTVNPKVQENSFDLDFNDEEYDGGSYIIYGDGSVVNMAVNPSERYGSINSTPTQIKNKFIDIQKQYKNAEFKDLIRNDGSVYGKRMVSELKYEGGGETFMAGGMTNEDILRSFLTSEKQTQTNNLATYYNEYDNQMLLRNYQTLIATRMGRRVNITNVKYSKTTSAITNRLKELAEEMGYNVSYVSEFAKGGMTEHGLMYGDKIRNDYSVVYPDDKKFKGIIDVTDKNGEIQIVNLDKGERYDEGGGVDSMSDEEIEDEYNKILSVQILAGDIDEDEVEELSISEKREFLENYEDEYAEGGVTKKRRRSPSVQYGGSDRLIDKQRSAKPVGYRFTDTFAKKKRKVNHAIPKKEEVKQFLGKGIYKESRRNRSDISRKVKL
jgi:hypothetical protein